MEIDVSDLMAQIGEQSVENRALRKAMDGAIARIQFLEGVCARHEIDLDAEPPVPAEPVVMPAAENGHAPNREQRRSAAKVKKAAR